MKKQILLYVCLLLSCSLSYPYSIVFIHIGPKLPNYLPVALEQARLFNEKCDIILLANHSAIKKCKSLENINIKTIALETLIKSQTHKEFIAYSKLDRNFREGFWFYTSERFLYLDDYMEQFNQHDTFHIENDTMLYVDIETIYPIFQQHYQHMAAIFDNDQRCIPCFVYIAKKDIAHQLATFFLQYAPQARSDMDILSLFRNHMGEKIVVNLPIIMPEYREKNPLKNSYGNTATNPSLYSNHFDLFDSIFDAASLGQYLGGIDPRNIPPIGPGFINESCLINPSYLQYEWHVDKKGRKVPYAIFENKKYRINNLHIHCKNLKKFSSLYNEE